MVKFALSANASAETPSGKAKNFTHLECDNDLQPVSDASGQYFCKHCMKVGYLVKPAKV